MPPAPPFLIQALANAHLSGNLVICIIRGAGEEPAGTIALWGPQDMKQQRS